MMPADPRQRVTGQGRAPLTGKILVAAMWALGLSSAFPTLGAGPAHADTVTADSCLTNLPVPTPRDGAVRVVQLINCSKETILGAANAAASAGNPLTSVFPREGTWVMAPVGSPNNANILTIDIPPAWVNTKPEHSVAPNLWARTGCRYDIAADKAQCETGGAGGVYDVSKAKLGPPGGTTITEWNFAEPSQRRDGGTYLKDSFDISAVNGVSLTVDIQSVGGSAEDPANPQTLNWLSKVGRLSVYGDDLRANANCPESFRLTRSQLVTGVYAFVIVGNNRQPLGGDGTVACFSNCGKYKFPLEPLQNCDISDKRCFNWKVFCAGDPTQYGKKCATDADCPVHASCWDNPGSAIDHTCQLRAFISKAPCDPAVCTFPYGAINPFTHQPDFSTQPPFGLCSDVDPTNTDAFCIGDDRVHKVFPRAYTWPNDPQVYVDDAPLYRVIFSPGGTNVKITPSVGALPLCKGLPEIYDYTSASRNCAIDINNGAVFAIARLNPTNWSCNLGAGAGNDGVICRWKAATLQGSPSALSFEGVPGEADCENDSTAAVARLYGGLTGAAPLLGFSTIRGLEDAIRDFCQGS